MTDMDMEINAFASASALEEISLSRRDRRLGVSPNLGKLPLQGDPLSKPCKQT
jgi:hypothetical protein